MLHCTKGHPRQPRICFLNAATSKSMVGHFLSSGLLIKSTRLSLEKCCISSGASYPNFGEEDRSLSGPLGSKDGTGFQSLAQASASSTSSLFDGCSPRSPHTRLHPNPPLLFLVHYKACGSRAACGCWFSAIGGERIAGNWVRNIGILICRTNSDMVASEMD